MASVSTWADKVRGPATASLHYVNLPEHDCEYSQARDCQGGRCVVAAIDAKVAELRSNVPDSEKLVALKWVIHLVGDVHQPLHVGLAHDRGGNLAQVRAFGRGSNLHSVWDAALISRRTGGIDQLLRDAAESGSDAARVTSPSQWANESCAIRSSFNFYPENGAVDMAYAVRWDGTLVMQLAKAGRRLADVLNDALRPR